MPGSFQGPACSNTKMLAQKCKKELVAKTKESRLLAEARGLLQVGCHPEQVKLSPGEKGSVVMSQPGVSQSLTPLSLLSSPA